MPLISLVICESYPYLCKTSSPVFAVMTTDKIESGYVGILRKCPLTCYTVERIGTTQPIPTLFNLFYLIMLSYTKNKDKYFTRSPGVFLSSRQSSMQYNSVFSVAAWQLSLAYRQSDS